MFKLSKTLVFLGGVGLIDYSNSAAENAVHWIFGFKIPVSLLKIFP